MKSAVRESRSMISTFAILVPTLDYGREDLVRDRTDL